MMKNRLSKKYLYLFVGLFVVIIASSIWYSFMKKSLAVDRSAQVMQEAIQFSDNEENFDIWSGPVRAIDTDNGARAIIIEGEIRKGYFKRFAQIVKKTGSEYSSVWLFSPGGDAIEAMKIGYLIRQLRYGTIVFPSKVNNCGLVGHIGIEPINCTCESACFLMHMAGVNRMASMLGIHRVYLNHDALQSVNAEDAIKIAKSIKRDVAEYLREMGTPAEIMERLFSVPSNKMEFLSKNELKLVDGEIEEVQEWISAQCPVKSNQEAKAMLYQRGYTDEKIKGLEFIYSAAELEHSDCRRDAIKSIAQIGWKRVFGSSDH